MRALMIGDVIGKPGRRAVARTLPALRRELGLDLVIANGENSAGGRGLTLSTAAELFEAGVDVLTSGNHIWDQKEIIPYLDGEMPIVRPLNYPPGLPGKGFLVWNDTLIINLMGRVFISNFDCPFRAFDSVLAQVDPLPSRIVVDFHAEATSEKIAFGWYVDGRASAVVGTHTHVPTADTRVLPRGTAYVSDVGMVGPMNSVIGMQIDTVMERFLHQTPTQMDVASGPVIFNSVFMEIDDDTGRAREIRRLDSQAD
ncbi:MAG: TIGR00282 family metallophosphoesterase [Dehalococcoidia bacterium]|nr:TIGR00282 family metallophosphoesterase [Dehalococcoidia bacterium]